MAGLKSPKPPGGGPTVRQMRGPGMNKGLKKPRHGKFSTAETGQSGGPSVPRPGQSPSDPSRNDYSKGKSYLSKRIWK